METAIIEKAAEVENEVDEEFGELLWLPEIVLVYITAAN
jgi:hypothetical protein